MPVFDSVRNSVNNNVDKRIAFSAAVGVAGLGLVAFLARKSGISFFKTAANVATEGKK